MHVSILLESGEFMRGQYWGKGAGGGLPPNSADNSNVPKRRRRRIPGTIHH